jgi:simple sugar transport system permease protein
MNNVIDLIFNAEFVFTALRVMTPILFASLACMMFYKGGVDAIGTEGMMLMSALAGVIGAHYTKSYVVGILAGMLCGALLSILYVYMTNRMLANDILAGISVNNFGSGITVFLLYILAGEKGSSQNLPSPTVPNIEIPFLENIPFLGDVLSGHSLLTYLGFVMVVFTYFFIYKTPIGLRIRAVGKNPGAASSVGIHVVKTRYLSAGMAGALAGLGGVFMSMSYISNFTRDMVAGRGFIGMAAEGMGRGNPIGVFLSSILFGVVDSLAIRLQSANLPSRLVQALPYIITIIVITVYSYIDKEKKKRVRGGVSS